MGRMQSTPSAATSDIDAQRAILRTSINQIADEVGIAMRDAGFRFPVYLTVRNSGEPLATAATPLDRSNTDWDHAITIVCQIIGKWVGSDKLRGRELACAIANAARITATELADDNATSDPNP